MPLYQRPGKEDGGTDQKENSKNKHNCFPWTMGLRRRSLAGGVWLNQKRRVHAPFPLFQLWDLRPVRSPSPQGNFLS